MRLRLSRFVHLIPVGPDRVLVVDAISNVRLTVTEEAAGIIQGFSAPIEVEDLGPLQILVERGVLTEKTPEEELAHVTALLAPYHGRDPNEMLERYRRQSKEGAHEYWAAGDALTLETLGGTGRRIDVLLFGECDMHMESDFLRQEASAHKLDLRVAATFPDDLRLAEERPHDAIIIGALRWRHAITDSPPAGAAAHAGFIAEARHMLDTLRRQTPAPILIDNLPEPTVQPLGLAERGVLGHRNRFRAANLALAELVESYADVHVVDIAAALAAVGSQNLLDDGLVGFTHFGSPGWLLQRAEDEKRAVHGQFPDLTSFAQGLGGNPYGREAVTARAHMDALMTTLAIDRKKCVIVDLDGLLWPGVLAETGSPFAWSQDISPPYSYVGLFFGLHEALLSLKKRGILLACVSKNDEATVRALWKYESHYPHKLLLKPDDFVTWRVNWDNKVDNIRAIADELGLALESFIFLDDSPVERERVRQRLPEVEVWGDDPFKLRRRLLTDPRLQLPRITGEAAQRTELTRSQLGRQSARAESASEAEFLASLALEVRIVQLPPGDDATRVVELFQRTTQFNTTGMKLTVGQIAQLLTNPDNRIYAAHVRDRFGDQGLVGAAVVQDGEITGFALSCRVLGLGVEHQFLQHILAELMQCHPSITARIIATPRNHPVRNLYRDNGFEPQEDGIWRRGRL
ncbi:MAG: HAD-IIIC family phosphatase [Alphaproteobacteria bacterium]|nr:HAD-IIIC family phosphatase [Alphaproteobacteria bacterium]